MGQSASLQIKPITLPKHCVPSQWRKARYPELSPDKFRDQYRANEKALMNPPRSQAVDIILKVNKAPTQTKMAKTHCLRHRFWKKK